MVVHSGMNDEIRCLVLKSQDYKEADSILTVLTKEYGKITFFAKGVRKIHSKNASQIQLYCESDFLYDHTDGKSAFTLKTAHCHNYFRHMKEDLASGIAAGIICETVTGLLEEGERVNGIYDIVLASFQLLDEGKDTDTVLALFLSDVMKISGLAVHVDSCSLCGSKSVHAISIEDGGFVCERCAHEKGIPLSSVEDLKRFRLLGKGSLKNYAVIAEMGGAARKDVNLFMSILRRHSGIAVRSYDLYKQI